MGFKREFNFEEDIELLNLKYQISDTNFLNYFQNELGANEPIHEKSKEEIKKYDNLL